MAPFGRGEGARCGLHTHPGEVEGRRDGVGQALSDPAVAGKDAEIEVRQLYELDDFGPSEAVERFRKMDVG